MKKKLFLDIVMTFIMVMLMDTFITGMLLHEILGIAVFLLFIVHKVFNYKWIKGIIHNFSNPKVPKKQKLMLVLDTILFACVTFLIVSGILISKALVPSLAVGGHTFSIWHKFTAYSSIIIISIHIGLHWNMIMNVFKTAFGITGENKLRTAFLRAASLIIAVLGLNNLMSGNYINGLSAPFRVSGTPQGEGKGQFKESSSDNFSERRPNREHSDKTSFTQNSSSEMSDEVKEHLGSLFCTGCGKRCPLTSPQCGKGMAQQQAAIEEFNSANTQSSSQSNQASDIPSAQPLPQASSGITASVMEQLEIMGLFIAGTHYAVSFPKRKREDSITDEEAPQ